MTDWKYKTEGELNDAGYRFRHTGTCNGETCQQRIEWWLTPKGKRIPLDEGTLAPHFQTCADAKQFRESREKAAEANAPACYCCIPPRSHVKVCAALRCTANVERVMMCSHHWAMVPDGLKGAVLRAHKAWSTAGGYSRYRAARKAAIDIVAQKEGKVA